MITRTKGLQACSNPSTSVTGLLPRCWQGPSPTLSSRGRPGRGALGSDRPGTKSGAGPLALLPASADPQPLTPKSREFSALQTAVSGTRASADKKSAEDRRRTALGASTRAASVSPSSRSKMHPVPCRASRTPGLLCALLALLLLLPEPQVHAGPVAAMRELRCVCLTITQGVHPKMIASLQVTASGPHCPRVEVVASLKNGKQICLDPEAPLFKKVIQKMLDSGNKQN
ncbi:PREDICTED: uncharacterized protein LOC102027175 isoform X2 [Chinchilla lanigera]|nr:PREDICTED: uncharacterized protein LOC102027175 isoform X2 [Chinchilla lanigera]